MKPKREEAYESHNSASLAAAERRIQTLEQENLKLKREIADVSSLYKVLVKDGENEKHDERRVNLLKSQLIQLERQVLMLTDSLGSRATNLLEIENGLHDIADIVRSHVGEERGAVTMPRDSLKKIIDTAESCRIKLSKDIENATPEKHARPLLMMDRFVKESTGRQVSLYDVCSGSIEHINLKHVSKLESRLSQVYQELTTVAHSMALTWSRDTELLKNSDIASNLGVRLACQVTRTRELIKQTKQDLLELSLLVPSAPWPLLQKSRLKDITTEDVLTSLPNFPKSRSAEGQQKIKALITAYNYIISMTNLELNATSKELSYHRAIYGLQEDYIESLLDSMKTAYANFEKSANDIICKPLKDIVDKYKDLEQTASESDLKDFLTSFKQHAPQIINVIDQLKKNEEEKVGVDALSSFGEQFFETVRKLRTECENVRDKSLAELQSVKDDNEEYQAELKQLFPSVSDQEASEQAQREYQQVVTKTIDASPNVDAATGHTRPQDFPESIESSTGFMGSSPIVESSARSRRRAAKTVAAAASPGSLPYLPAEGGHSFSLENTTAIAQEVSGLLNEEDAPCTCGSDVKPWDNSPLRYTPDSARPPLGPIKTTRRSESGASSPTSQVRKAVPSKLPKVRARSPFSPASGIKTPQSRIPVTPQSGTRPASTPKSGSVPKVAQSKLSLRPRNDRSLSLDNSDQNAPLLNQSPGASPSMKRSSSLSNRPDWVS